MENLRRQLASLGDQTNLDLTMYLGSETASAFRELGHYFVQVLDKEMAAKACSKNLTGKYSKQAGEKMAKVINQAGRLLINVPLLTVDSNGYLTIARPR